MYYTGIGSRSTPSDILHIESRIASYLGAAGYVLRSGGAVGSDSAFEEGAKSYRKVIYLPWDGFNNKYVSSYLPGECIVHNSSLPAFDRAVKALIDIHPAIDKLNPITWKLHTRNMYQVTGHQRIPDLSNFVIYWAPWGSDGLPRGGTRTAIECAQLCGVATYNLADRTVCDKIVARARQLQPRLLAGLPL